MKDRTLIELVNAIPKPLPASAIKIEDSLGVPLKVVSETTYWLKYTSHPVMTADGYRISEIDIRLATAERKRTMPGIGSLLVLWIDTATCVPPQLIETELGISSPGDLVIDDPSSQNFYVPVPWGKFSMGVRTFVSGKQCVYAIAVKNGAGS